MTCREFLDLVQQRLDGAGALSETGLENHLRECPACADRFRAARLLSQGLRLLAPPLPPPGLERQISSSVRSALRRRRLARRGAIAGSLAAAAILVAIGLRMSTVPPRPSANRETAQRALVTPRESALPDRSKAQNPSLRNTLAEAGDAVASLTSRTTDEAIDQTRLLLPIVSRPSLGEVELRSDTTARPLREAGQNITAGLGPVATSARRAVDLFLRDIPPLSGQERNGL
jgi:hypothetical protein